MVHFMLGFISACLGTVFALQVCQSIAKMSPVLSGIIAFSGFILGGLFYACTVFSND